MGKEKRPVVKKIPERLCIACGALKPKKSLLRIVREADGMISLDPGGKKNGRGAYICPKGDCFAGIKKTRALDRSFKTGVEKEVYERLIRDFTEGFLAAPFLGETKDDGVPPKRGGSIERQG